MVYIRSEVLLTPDLGEIPQTEINGSTTNKQTLSCAAGLNVSAEHVTRLAKVEIPPVCFGLLCRQEALDEVAVAIWDSATSW